MSIIRIETGRRERLARRSSPCRFMTPVARFRHPVSWSMMPCCCSSWSTRRLRRAKARGATAAVDAIRSVCESSGIFCTPSTPTTVGPTIKGKHTTSSSSTPSRSAPGAAIAEQRLLRQLLLGFDGSLGTVRGGLGNLNPDLFPPSEQPIAAVAEERRQLLAKRALQGLLVEGGGQRVSERQQSFELVRFLTRKAGLSGGLDTLPGLRNGERHRQYGQGRQEREVVLVFDRRDRVEKLLQRLAEQGDRRDDQRNRERGVGPTHYPHCDKASRGLQNVAAGKRRANRNSIRVTGKQVPCQYGMHTSATNGGLRRRERQRIRSSADGSCKRSPANRPVSHCGLSAHGRPALNAVRGKSRPCGNRGGQNRPVFHITAQPSRRDPRWRLWGESRRGYDSRTPSMSITRSTALSLRWR